MPETAAALMPKRQSLPALRRAAAGCQACELWKLGTRTVFGEGARTADVVLVGETPGQSVCRPQNRSHPGKKERKVYLATDAHGPFEQGERPGQVALAE